MKTYIKPLIITFSLSLVSLSASWAASDPIGQSKPVATYKTAIYSTLNGKLRIALDKEKGIPVDIRLKSSKGQTYFVQHLNRNDQKFRARLDVSELPDGEYQVEITNGVDLTVHLLTLSTQQPSTPTRLVAIN